jgi:hypothetical protein
MLGLALTLLFLAVGVGALAAAGTALIQGYLYNQPVSGISWKSAATGAAVGLFFALWCGLESRAPGRYASLLDFSPREVTTFDTFWAEQTGDSGKRQVRYTRGRNDRGRVTYYDADHVPWQRSSSNGMVTAIIVEEDGEKKRFEAELQNGRFKADEAARYVEQGGRHRVMTDVDIGEVVTTRYGVLIGNFLLNLAHLLVWFLCLWLLLQFQWPHALGMAFALWLAFSLAVWPIVRGYVPHG